MEVMDLNKNYRQIIVKMKSPVVIITHLTFLIHCANDHKNKNRINVKK